MIKKVKTFFKVFSQSLLPNRFYYSKILKTHFSFSFKYLLTLIFILNLIFIFSLFIKYNPKKINSSLNSFIKALSYYPDDLIINVSKGKIITNYNRPYLLWLENKEKKELFLVIDESASAQKISLYNSHLLLTPHEVVIKNKKTNEIIAFPLNQLTDHRITKENIKKVISNLAFFQKFLLPLYLLVSIVFLFIISILSFIIIGFYLLIASLCIFFIYKLTLKKHFHFKKILQVSFHATTFPLLLDYGLMIVKPTIQINNQFISFFKYLPLPFVFFVCLVFFIAVGVYEAHAKHSASLSK